MALYSSQVSKQFRLSQLLNDKRYRAYTFQFFALFVLICIIAYLGRNLVQNLAAAGLNISYSFLGEPAGYDINQRLIDYNSQSTHLRATFVGILNTLLVAFLACITATIVGVTAGILRLSNNWIVAKLMTIYVEIFRNVPILIWILIVNSIFWLSFHNQKVLGVKIRMQLCFGMRLPSRDVASMRRSPYFLRVARLLLQPLSYL